MNTTNAAYVVSQQFEHSSSAGENWYLGFIMLALLIVSFGFAYGISAKQKK